MSLDEELRRGQIVSGDLGNDDTRLHAFGNDLTLALRRPLAPSKLTIDNLEQIDLMNISVTSTVKFRRHLMIPKRTKSKANQACILKLPAEQRLLYIRPSET